MTSWLPAALTNHLWQSTLVVIVVWLVTLTLRGNAARVRCWLWTAASVKFLVPLSLLVGLGERLQWRAAPAAVQPAVSFVMDDVLQPAYVAVGAPASIPESAPMWPWWLLALWCAGAAVVFASWWRQWLPIRAALRTATPLPLDAQYDAADLVVMSSPSMPEPGVVGIWRPRLLLPSGMSDRLTPSQLRALIAHERCHVRCHDNFTAALHLAVEALFWFHPAVWWIERRLVDERERACDEAVLRSGSRPQDYVEGILEVCRQSVGAQVAGVAGVTGSNLRARVEAIMRNEIGRPISRRRRWALAAAVVAAVGGPVAGGALTARSQAVVPPAGVVFQAASVKPGKRVPAPGPDLALEAELQRASMSRLRNRQTTMLSGPLHTFVQVAYNVIRTQVEGGPSWVRSDRYEIEGRAGPDATPEQIRGMLQSLLADRFTLTLRRETRALPIYELVIADGGLKIAAMREGECVKPGEIRWESIDLEAPLYACDGFGRRVLSQSPETRPLPRWPRVTRIQAGAATMAALINYISIDVDRVILDKTGFTAPFNFFLDFASAREAGLGPTIFTALEEQLGLRLRPASGPVDVLVIDRAERPSEN